MIAICTSESTARNLKTIDFFTTKPTQQVYIKGDTRYRLTNVFVNPCESLFNYSSTIPTTETLIKNCFNHFERKLLRTLTNCNKLPTIGPDLTKVPQNYDCVGNHYGSAVDESGEFEPGRCEVINNQD